MIPESDRPGGGDSRLGDRLIGLALMLASLLGFGLVYLLWLVGPLMPPAPRGLPPGMLPMLSPLSCLVPGAAIGCCALFVLGLRRLLFPE
jgi:hypothetical protein